MGVQQSEIAFLHLIKQMPGAKPAARSKPRLNKLAIQGLTGDDQSVFIWHEAGCERYCLQELSQPELTLLQQFMTRRLSEGEQRSLAGTTHRNQLRGKAVIFQHSTFSPQVPGRLVIHAMDDSYSQLGDCWLVQSPKTQYLPAQYLYLAPQYENVTMFPVVH